MDLEVLGSSQRSLQANPTLVPATLFPIIPKTFGMIFRVLSQRFVALAANQGS